MENERINIQAYTLMFTAERGIFEELFLRNHSLSAIAELKRMYEREDELVEILSILEDRHGVDMSQFFEKEASE